MRQDNTVRYCENCRYNEALIAYSRFRSKLGYCSKYCETKHKTRWWTFHGSVLVFTMFVMRISSGLNHWQNGLTLENFSLLFDLLAIMLIMSYVVSIIQMALALKQKRYEMPENLVY